MHPAIANLARLQQAAAYWTTSQLCQLRTMAKEQRAVIQAKSKEQESLQAINSCLSAEKIQLDRKLGEAMRSKDQADSEVARLTTKCDQLALDCESTANHRDHYKEKYRSLQDANKELDLMLKASRKDSSGSLQQMQEQRCWVMWDFLFV
ncbi:hypothetical protein B0I35DRAFT_432582 [Stachybotrys elegans]|uniref:Uncharacterized protein n=1 Tax=Stachybotrys elegans TaxID=80388 RepID=A0A8K0WQY9_9HYPO|nr:hypothetical protein B0I35DRAFT_432582 [Stachybotrys elegans]